MCFITVSHGLRVRHEDGLAHLFANRVVLEERKANRFSKANGRAHVPCHRSHNLLSYRISSEQRSMHACHYDPEFLLSEILSDILMMQKFRQINRMERRP